MLRAAPETTTAGLSPGLRRADVPLLLLAGTLCDQRLFAPVLQRLGRPDAQVVQMRGARSASEMAKTVLADAPARFALAGFSLGGIVALEMVAEAPERIERLALIATTARADPAANAAARRAGVAEARCSGIDTYVESLLPIWLRHNPGGAAQLAAVLKAMARNSGPETLDEQSEIAIARADSRARLARIAVPTLVLCGADDAVCPPDRHEEIAAAIAGARLVTVPGAGHFLPLEDPGATTEALASWLVQSEHVTRPLQGDDMADADTTQKPAKIAKAGDAGPSTAPVLQVERRDFVDLVPEDRKRVQPMQGFDPIYTDIVDYIIRCTHRIWDERDVGLIYTHYTHNCVVYTSSGTFYNREDIVRDTIQRLVSLPERRGLATQVVWSGDDQKGFYTSHLVTGTGRHTQHGHYGPPTGRTFVSRTIADCMVYENKIYREWIVADIMAILKQLGLDPHVFATKMAKNYFDKGQLPLDIGENRRMIGQYPPEADPVLDIATTDLERETLGWLHEVYNRRMFGRIKDFYAPTVQYHGPLMTELYGIAAVMHQTVGLIGSIPDASFEPQHICSTPCEEGGTKVAVRWIMEGHHIGYGILTELGEPTGKRLQIMGMSHFHYKNGKIVDEWRVYDELSLLMQIKLAQMADAPVPPTS